MILPKISGGKKAQVFIIPLDPGRPWSPRSPLRPGKPGVPFGPAVKGNICMKIQ